jgi:hypothetical protein
MRMIRVHNINPQQPRASAYTPAAPQAPPLSRDAGRNVYRPSNTRPLPAPSSCAVRGSGIRGDGYLSTRSRYGSGRVGYADGAWKTAHDGARHRAHLSKRNPLPRCPTDVRPGINARAGHSTHRKGTEERAPGNAGRGIRITAHAPRTYAHDQTLRDAWKRGRAQSLVAWVNAVCARHARAPIYPSIHPQNQWARWGCPMHSSTPFSAPAPHRLSSPAAASRRRPAGVDAETGGLGAAAKRNRVWERAVLVRDGVRAAEADARPHDGHDRIQTENCNETKRRAT